MADKLSARLNAAKGFSQLSFKEIGIMWGYNNLYFQGVSMEEINRAKTYILNIYTKRRYCLTDICVGIIYAF